MVALIFLLVLSFSILIAVDVLSYSLGLKTWQRFASTFLVFYFQITTSQLLLGVASILTRKNLVVANILISLAILLYASRKRGSRIVIEYAKSLLKSVSAASKNIQGDYPYIILLVMAVIAVGYVMFIGVIFPATDFDGNSYHLTTVGYAIQNSSINDVESSLPWLLGYPKGGELMALWSTIIGKRDIFADMIQVPYLLLGIYALYSISLRIGVNKRSARYSSLLFVFIPVVLNQMKTTYVDLILCSLFFTAIAFVIQKKMTKLDLFLLGITYSLMLSVKFTGALFVAATLPFLFWSLYGLNGRKIKNAIGAYITQLGIIALPVLTGIYWYIKNYVVYESPLHPFGLKVAGLSVFPGKTFQEFAANANNAVTALPKGYFERIWFAWTEQEDWFGCFYNYDANFTGLGPLWLVLFLPSILVSAYLMFKRRNYTLMGLFAVFSAVFLVYPANFYSRYTLFIVGLGIVSLGYVLTNTKKITNNAIKIIVPVLAFIVMTTNVTLCNFPPHTLNNQISNVENRVFKGGATYWQTIGPAYAHLQNTIAPGETVAYDSKPYFIYPLWKQDFSNKVTYVPAENKEDWYSGIEDQDVRYVFTVVYSIEHDWAESDNKYDSIYEDETYEIYKVY